MNMSDVENNEHFGGIQEEVRQKTFQNIMNPKGSDNFESSDNALFIPPMPRQPTENLRTQLRGLERRIGRLESREYDLKTDDRFSNLSRERYALSEEKIVEKVLNDIEIKKKIKTEIIESILAPLSLGTSVAMLILALVSLNNPILAVPPLGIAILSIFAFYKIKREYGLKIKDVI